MATSAYATMARVSVSQHSQWPSSSCSSSPCVSVGTPSARVELRKRRNRGSLRAQASSSSSSSYSPQPLASSSYPTQEPASSSALQVHKPPQQAPIIELEFIAPDNRPGENDPIPGPQYCTAVSGEKLLRDVMLDNHIELYGPYGKMMNCEGRGMCGTCLVDILEGAELTNKRTPAEPYYLKLRPDSWRLACQATVGDGTNGGKIKVKRRPQKGHPLM